MPAPGTKYPVNGSLKQGTNSRAESNCEHGDDIGEIAVLRLIIPTYPISDEAHERKIFLGSSRDCSSIWMLSRHGTTSATLRSDVDVLKRSSEYRLVRTNRCISARKNTYPELTELFLPARISWQNRR